MNKKTYTHLSFEERETLPLGVAQGQSLHQLATVLGRSPSTLSRERTRNTTGKAPYRECLAQPRAPRLAVSKLGTRGNSWIPDCGGTSAHTWPTDARPNKLPDASDGSILGHAETPLAETIYMGLYILPRGTAEKVDL